MYKRLLGELGKQSESKLYEQIKSVLSRIDSTLPSNKNIAKEKLENYVRIIKEMNWGVGKTKPFWPSTVQKLMEELKEVLKDTERQISETDKGSSFFCGSASNPKQLEGAFKRLAAYECVFKLIGAYQEAQIRENTVDQIATILEKEGGKSLSLQLSDQSVSKTKTDQEMCSYCELMKAVSVCPNGYVAKKLLKELPNTEWIAGILHQEGNIIDKDIKRAIQYYEKGRAKNNYQAVYRLGLLNERGQYGKPYEYLNLWEEAGANGHLEALTDMGYLYENGLEDQDTGKIRLAPNYQKALAYYSKAAEKNFPRALNNLATFYFNNEKYKDQKKCLDYFERAADAEYVKSLHNLGLLYEQGLIMKVDLGKARALIKRSAEKGDSEGKLKHVEFVLADPQKYTGDDLVEIGRYCREVIAKQEDNPQAYYLLGLIYEQGCGVAKSPKQAILYYTLATGLNSGSAYMRLGECYRNGFGVEQSMIEALACYEKAVKTNPPALVILGQIYEKGCPQIKQNYERAFNYYYEGCNQSVPEAFQHLGNMYKHGRYVSKNDEKAEKYFKEGRALLIGQHSKLEASSQLIQSSYYRKR